MKKLIFLLVIFASCSFNEPYTASPTWNALAANQGFSGNTFLDAIQNNIPVNYATTGNLPQTNKLIRKDDFLTACTGSLFFNSAYPSFANKSSSQIVCKRDITLVLVMSTAHGTTPCTPYSGSQTLYTDGYVTRFYTDSALTIPYVGSGEYYYQYNIGISVMINSSGYTSNYSLC